MCRCRRALEPQNSVYSKAFDDIRGEEIAPGGSLRSDADIEFFVRRIASTTWHPVGTCKMGKDEMAVVDHYLRVRGIEALRVVEASIIRTILSGNADAPNDHDRRRGCGTDSRKVRILPWPRSSTFWLLVTGPET